MLLHDYIFSRSFHYGKYCDVACCFRVIFDSQEGWLLRILIARKGGGKVGGVVNTMNTYRMGPTDRTAPGAVICMSGGGSHGGAGYPSFMI